MPSAAFMKALAASQKKVAKAIRDPKTAGTIKYVKTSSPRLNGTYGSGKGIAIGRIHRLMGPESGGKTAICTFVQKEFQQKLDVQHPELGKKPISIWIDFEGFDNAHATEMGLDTTSVFDGFTDKGEPIWNKDGRFLLVQPDSIEDAGVAIEELVRSGEVGSIVFDSESLATTRTIQENEMGKATFGGKAKMLGEFLTKFNILCRNYDTTMFIISQERANMAMMSHAIVTTGGYALRYAASTLNRVKKVVDLKDGTGKMIGIQMNVRNYKNKTGIPFRENDMWLYFDRGFDAEGEYIDLVKELQSDPRMTALCKIGGAYWKSDKWGWSYKSKDSFIADFVHNAACKDMWEEMKLTIDDILSGAIESDKETGDPEQMAEQNETYMDSAEAKAEMESYKEVEKTTQDSIVKKEDGLVTESETPEVILSEVD